jgi:hypothetical protein
MFFYFQNVLALLPAIQPMHFSVMTYLVERLDSSIPVPQKNARLLYDTVDSLKADFSRSKPHLQRFLIRSDTVIVVEDFTQESAIWFQALCFARSQQRYALRGHISVMFCAVTSALCFARSHQRYALRGHISVMLCAVTTRAVIH